MRQITYTCTASCKRPSDEQQAPLVLLVQVLTSRENYVVLHAQLHPEPHIRVGHAYAQTLMHINPLLVVCCLDMLITITTVPSHGRASRSAATQQAS